MLTTTLSARRTGLFAPAVRSSSRRNCIVVRFTNLSKKSSHGNRIPKEPEAFAKPVAHPFCEYIQKRAQVQQAAEAAVSNLGEGGKKLSCLDIAVVRLFSATALHSLMLNNVSSGKVTAGAVDCQQRSVRDAVRTAAILLLNRLNGANTLPGLDFLSVPYNMSLSLMDTLLPLGLITPGGQPVLRQQAQHSFKVSAQQFRHMEPDFVGRWDEVFGSDDMVAVPDAYPWLSPSDFNNILGFESALMSHMHTINTAATQHLICITGNLIPHMPAQPSSQQSISIWITQLVRKFPCTFSNNANASTAARACSEKFTTATWASNRAGEGSGPRVSGEGSGPRVSGDGGSGSRGCFTAVGGDDEGEKVCTGAVCVPIVRAAGMQDEEASGNLGSRMVGKVVSRVSRLAGRLLGRKW